MNRKLFGLDEEISYQMNLNQAYVAREFSKWLKKKGEVKSFVSKNMNDSLYYVESNRCRGYLFKRTICF